MALNVLEYEERTLRPMIERMVKALVDQPSRVRVTPAFLTDGLVMNLSVAKEDAGKVIGKGGVTARSLRTIVQSAGRKAGIVCRLNVETIKESL